MYSVEDLLISHGYKPSQDPPAPREDIPKRRQPARTRTQASQGLSNGYKDVPAAQAHSRTSLGTGHVNNSESRCRKPKGHGEGQRTCAPGTSEAGFLNQSASAWSSHPQTGSDHSYWRRGRQEASSLLGPRDQKDLEARRMAQTRSLPVHAREGPWEVAGRIEHVMKKAMREEEVRVPCPAKWQDANLESWKQPRQLGRPIFDGDGEKVFQNLYPFDPGEHMVSSQNKRKFQSLPRVLSPENLSFTEIPIPLHDGLFPGIPEVPPHPPGCPPPPEPTRNPEKTGVSGSFPRPRFGKPVKPSSHGSQPQSKAGEDCSFQERQHKEPHSSFLPRSRDPRHELGVLDSGLEPPVYVPPPSYKSPPQHIPNPYLEDPVPRPVSSSQGPQQHLPETPGAGSPFPSGSLVCESHHLEAVPGSPPRGVPPRPFSAAACGGSIQYIPFNDPRIRHIKLTQPPDGYEEAKLDDRAYSSGPLTTQEPSRGKTQCNNALPAPQGLIPQSENARGPAFAESSPRWLPGPRDIEHGSFPGHTDQPVLRGPLTDRRDTQHNQAVGHAPSPYSESEGPCDTHTKLRKFETGIQTKKYSKRKNETVFCLVSIPVKSESHLPHTDGNNNDLKLTTDQTHGPAKNTALEEQSLLSMSSTDLELQALMGNMAWRKEFPKQGLEEPGDELTNDLRFSHLTKPRELRASSSWPSQQYRDQQTQTSFPEDLKSSQLLPATKPGGPSGTAPAPKCPDSAASKAHTPTALVYSDQRQKPSAPPFRGQTSLSPSHNSAFSRTSSAVNQVPKGGSAKPGMDVHAPGGSPVPKPEVVKGECASGPCNSMQPFGQFLLKPVSRRPWDLISQLESFNKELQEEEESHGAGDGSSDEDGEAEQDSTDSRPSAPGYDDSTDFRPSARGYDDSTDSRPSTLGYDDSTDFRPSAPGCGDSTDFRPSAPGCGDSTDFRPNALGYAETRQGEKVEQHPTARVPEDPGLRDRRLKSISRSWSEKPQPGHTRPGPASPGRSQEEDSRDEPAGLPDGSRMAEQQSQGTVNGACEPVSPGPPSRMGPSGASNTKATPPSHLQDLKENQEFGKLSEALGAVQLSRHTPPKVHSGKEGDTEALLPLVNKYQGFSAPDLRSLGLTLGKEQRVLESDEPLGVERVMEPLPSESLQERAERILGIEVAMESLLPGAKRGGQSQTPEPNESACSPESPRKDSLPISAPLGGPTVTTNTFYGRRKCGWTESPLFVGERAPQASMCSGRDEVPAGKVTSPEPLLSPSECKSFEKDEEAKPPFKSTLFHFMDKTPSAVGSEKRLRSPSKVIESLQEKLASPPRRADPDRLVRMWEVSSLSRMRCLSASRRADSVLEPEHLKAAGDQAWQAGHPSSVTQGVITREENGHPETSKEKMADQDFWCPDSYDPSRVERV